GPRGRCGGRRIAAGTVSSRFCGLLCNNQLYEYGRVNPCIQTVRLSMLVWEPDVGGVSPIAPNVSIAENGRADPGNIGTRPRILQGDEAAQMFGNKWPQETAGRGHVACTDVGVRLNRDRAAAF